MRRQNFKAALWPALLSGFILPGLGQIANREFSKGLFLMGTAVGSFLWFSNVITEQLALILPGTPDLWVKDQGALRQAILHLVEKYSSIFLTFQLLLLLVWAFGVLDAYFSARSIIKRGGFPEKKPDDDDTDIFS